MCVIGPRKPDKETIALNDLIYQLCNDPPEKVNETAAAIRRQFDEKAKLDRTSGLY